MWINEKKCIKKLGIYKCCKIKKKNTKYKINIQCVFVMYRITNNWDVGDNGPWFPISRGGDDIREIEFDILDCAEYAFDTFR